jgi:hypothetical protein
MVKGLLRLLRKIFYRENSVFQEFNSKDIDVFPSFEYFKYKNCKLCKNFIRFHNKNIGRCTICGLTIAEEGTTEASSCWYKHAERACCAKFKK